MLIKTHIYFMCLLLANGDRNFVIGGDWK